MKNTLTDFLKFRSFVTHNIVKVLFWFFSGLLLLAYPFVVLTSTFQDGLLAGLGSFILGGVGIACAILILRVYAELVIVVFGIHDELKQMNDRQR